MNLKEFYVMEMGNMSALEKKVEVLTRYCTAKTEAERSECHSALERIDASQYSAGQCKFVVEGMLRDLGIPDHLRGFACLQTAIILVMRSPQMIYNAMTVLYPLVGTEHGMEVASVERAMRTAIETGWDRCGEQMQYKYFLLQVDPKRGKPSNTHFIARLARHAQNLLQN